MKTKTLALGIVIGILNSTVVAGPPSYGGASDLGYVTIGDNGTYIHASFNVRFNPAPGHEQSYITGFYSPGDSVHFLGYDSSKDLIFSCVVNSDSPVYLWATDIVDGLGDGAEVLIEKESGGNNCTKISWGKASSNQH